MKGTPLVKAFERVKEKSEATRMNIRERVRQVLVLRFEKEDIIDTRFTTSNDLRTFPDRV